MLAHKFDKLVYYVKPGARARALGVCVCDRVCAGCALEHTPKDTMRHVNLYANTNTDREGAGVGRSVGGGRDDSGNSGILTDS